MLELMNELGNYACTSLSPSALSTFDGEQAKHLVESGSMLVRTLDVEVLTLTGIWTRYADSLKKVDLLCVDTEGMDLRVLRSNDFEKLNTEADPL